MRKLLLARLAVLALVVPATACTGDLTGDQGTAGTPGPNGPFGSGGNGSYSGGGNPSGGSSVATMPPPPPTVIRRLSNAEYNNTTRDLLGDTTHPADAFLVDERRRGFDNIAEAQTTSPVRAEQYMLTGEKLTTQAITAALAALPCAATGDAACAGQFIRAFGQKAYRRPLSETEVTRLLGVFNLGNGGGGFKHGVELVLRAMLISPSFLFRVEQGEAAAVAGLARPTAWEMASRLSYLLLGSMPDAQLFEAASQGALSTKEQVRAQAERLIADARAKTNIQHLHT
ncbi:MAG: DUF1595 domain-containing protein, partial [Ilumatobacteraceae bacterium]|nr:DUF1595 domain-containing protein [Ilumatobacteraceae bacterium]